MKNTQLCPLLSTLRAAAAAAALALSPLALGCAGAADDGPPGAADVAFLVEGDDDDEDGMIELTPPKETPCHTDGCALRKQAEFRAAYDWIYGRGFEQCSSVDFWPQIIARTADDEFMVVCGDGSTAQRVDLRLTSHTSDGELRMEVVREQAVRPQSQGESPSCTNDGCVRVKNAEYRAVVSFVQKSDECHSTVVWPTLVKKQNVQDYIVMCGDAASWTTLDLRVENPGQAMTADEVVVSLVKTH